MEEIAAGAGDWIVAGEHCWRSLEVAQETSELDLHVLSLVVQVRSERAAGHIAAARRWLEQAMAACTQLEISHINALASVVVELGHVAYAEEDWPQARQCYTEALRTKGCAAATRQKARAGLAEVAWAERDRAQANSWSRR